MCDAIIYMYIFRNKKLFLPLHIPLLLKQRFNNDVGVFFDDNDN